MQVIEMVQPWEDMRQIGDCTLYLGDARKVVPFLDGVGSIVTDPPYGMNFQSGRRKVKHRKIMSDDCDDLLIWACLQRPSHSSYVWMRWNNIPSLPRQPSSLITWVKNNHSMGDLKHTHGRKTEVAAFYRGPDHDFQNGRPCDVVTARRAGNNLHPTEKPVDLMMECVGWTRGLVLDPFMGSGTTGVACANMGRCFVGVEIDRGHFETAARRIEKTYQQSRLVAAQ